MPAFSNGKVVRPGKGAWQCGRGSSGKEGGVRGEASFRGERVLGGNQGGCGGKSQGVERSRAERELGWGGQFMPHQHVCVSVLPVGCGAGLRVHCR